MSLSGHEVQRHRVAEGISQEELARAASLSKGYVSQIETSKSGPISVAAATQIAAALSVSLDRLLKKEALLSDGNALQVPTDDARMLERILVLCEEAVSRLNALETRLDALEGARTRRKQHPGASR